MAQTVSMRLYLSLDGYGDRAIDCNNETRIKELIAALGGTDSDFLYVDRTMSTLFPEELVNSADLRSGDEIHLLPTPALPPQTSTKNLNSAVAGASGTMKMTRRRLQHRHAATLTVLNGRSRGQSVKLRFGQATIGRAPNNDVVVDDRGMSRRHAVVTVDDAAVTIADAGSTNGVVVDGLRLTNPATLHPKQRALVGRTWLEVDHHGRAPGLPDVTNNVIEFNRPPRIVERFEPQEVPLPEPPSKPGKQRFPKIMAIVPLIMGAVFIYAPVLFGGKPNYFYGLFMLMSPMMIAGSYVETKKSGRKDYHLAIEKFNESVKKTIARLERDHVEEVTSRRFESPSIDDVAGFVTDLSPRLWERGPDDIDMLSLRVGRATMPSRTSLVLPKGGEPELRVGIEQLPRRFSEVPDVPVVASFATMGGIGVSGPKESVTALAYSLLGQAAGLHSPAELMIGAMVSEEDVPEWDWLKWLPHCPHDDTPVGGPLAASSAAACSDLLSRLLELTADRRSQQSESLGGSKGLQTPAIIVVITEGVPVEQRFLMQLLESGPSVGIFPLWLAGASRRMPRPLGVSVNIEPDGRIAWVGYTKEDRIVNNVSIETFSKKQILGVARTVAPIVDVSGRFSTSAAVPSRVNLVDLIGGPGILDAPSEIAQRWTGPTESLRAPVGKTANGIFSLDIRSDGPHALVGGTTGAGKSEFLQTWVASMATTYSPEAVSFLLVDYKGGAAFKDCSKLPHTVGMVTDLDSSGVRRALVSMRAELRHREEILNEHNCSDLMQMITLGIEAAPPSLLVIVDEFAALVQEVPEFVEGMVDIAQRGRSLGLHLVLATQRPAGVITGQVRANTNLRVALRMADAGDSVDVIESKIAADIERSTPGRGVARIGPKELLQFQSGYVGGRTSIGDGDQTTVSSFSFYGVQEIEKPPMPSHTQNPSPMKTQSQAQTDVLPANFGNLEETSDLPPSRLEVAEEPDERNDLERLVVTLQAAHGETGKPLPRKPWLEPLNALCDVASLPRPVDDSRILLGMTDEPAQQEQLPMVFEPDEEGSLGIIGASGSGKTVALRTIAASVALTDHDGEETPWVYALDFAGRGLQVIEPLPHVGGVVPDDDPERVVRVLTDLQRLLNERALSFAEVRASSISEYRSARPDEKTNRVILLLDGFPAFYEAFEMVAMGRWITLFQRLLREGRQFGIHVVFTAPRRDSVYTTVSRAVGRWLILRQNSLDDYRNLEVPIDILTEHSPAGRAIVNKNEAQVAVLGGSALGENQSTALFEFAEQLRQQGAVEAPPIRTLPTLVDRDQVKRNTFALRDNDFGQQPLPAGFRVFVIAGPRSSGKTNALFTAGLSSVEPNAAVTLLSPKPMPLDEQALATKAGWRVAVGEDEIGVVFDRLVGWPGASPDIAPTAAELVLIDDLGVLNDLGMSPRIEELAALTAKGTIRLVVAVENMLARNQFNSFIRELTSHRTGVLLKPEPLDDTAVFGLDVPRVKTNLWSPGRGYLVADNGLQVVQVVAATTSTS